MVYRYSSISSYKDVIIEYLRSRGKESVLLRQFTSLCTYILNAYINKVHDNNIRQRSFRFCVVAINTKKAIKHRGEMQHRNTDWQPSTWQRRKNPGECEIVQKFTRMEGETQRHKYRNKTPIEDEEVKVCGNKVQMFQGRLLFSIRVGYNCWVL